MSLECSECERDLRGGHDVDCSRYPAQIDRLIADLREVGAELTEEAADALSDFKKLFSRGRSE